MDILRDKPMSLAFFDTQKKKKKLHSTEHTEQNIHN